MKQIIVVPNKITASFFELPCIKSAEKNNNDTWYILDKEYMVTGELETAWPGDTLQELDNGKWLRIRRCSVELKNGEKVLWHDGKEEPEPNKLVLFQFKSGGCDVFEGCEYNGLQHILRWLYLDDLN